MVKLVNFKCICKIYNNNFKTSLRPTAADLFNSLWLQTKLYSMPSFVPPRKNSKNVNQPHTITTHSKHNSVLKSPPLMLLKHSNIYIKVTPIYSKHIPIYLKHPNIFQTPQYILNATIHSKHPNIFETPQYIWNTPVSLG